MKNNVIVRCCTKQKKVCHMVTRHTSVAFSTHKCQQGKIDIRIQSNSTHRNGNMCVQFHFVAI